MKKLCPRKFTLSTQHQQLRNNALETLQIFVNEVLVSPTGAGAENLLVTVASGFAFTVTTLFQPPTLGFNWTDLNVAMQIIGGGASGPLIETMDFIFPFQLFSDASGYTKLPPNVQFAFQTYCFFFVFFKSDFLFWC